MIKWILNWFHSLSKKEKKLTIDEQYNVEKNKKEKRLNEILDKINQKGIEKLSQEEKQFLNNYKK